MGRTLVISDNEILNVLYPLNLEVYLATEVVVAKTFTEGTALLKKYKYDLVISLSTIKGKEVSEELSTYFKSYGIKSPLIILGKNLEEEEKQNVFGLPSKYDMRSLLKKSASILSITAKQMAEMKVGEYYGVKLTSLESLKTVPCTIFWQVENQHKVLAHRDDEFTPSFKTAFDKGAEKVFVRSNDRLVLINAISLLIVQKLTDALVNSEGATQEKKVEMLSEGFEFAALNLFSTEEIKQDIVKIAHASAKVMNDVVKDSPHLKGLLATLMNNQSGYVFTHSMVACYVSNHIIKNVTWGGEGQSEKINFVLFFHDIFLAPIYLKYPQIGSEGELLLSRDITEKEKETFLNHAKLAAELVVGYKRCPMGSDLLIKQHHGMKKGVGFALRYPEDLSPLAKILIVAEAFVEEFYKCHKEERKPEMKIIIPKLIENLGTPSYIKIVQTLVNMPI